MSRFRICLFSRFNVESDGNQSLKGIDARKAQELLSYLLLYRDRLHSRETLADLLWGDTSSIQARKYLRQALWQLQGALKLDGLPPEGELLIVDTEWVGINPGADMWLDVAEFEGAYTMAYGKLGHEMGEAQAMSLKKAVDIQPAGLLEGWYHDWCIFERERYHQMYLSMLNKLMAYAEAMEEYESGLLYGHRILQFDRAHERTHRRMMRLYYMSGDRTEALRQYERCGQAIEEELGVKPGRWTAALYEQISADQSGDLAVSMPGFHLREEPAIAIRPAERPNIDRLEALLTQFHDEVKQYVQAAGASATEK